MNWFKKLESKEYLELKKDLESLRIGFEGLKLDFDIIRSKLKIKRGIKDEPEKKEEDLYKGVLLPEPNGMV